MTEIELKPCPFCGGPARFYLPGRGAVVMCDSCGAEIKSLTLSDEAVANLWNRRAYEPRIKELEEEVEMLEDQAYERNMGRDL